MRTALIPVFTMDYGKAIRIGRALAGLHQKDLAFLAGTDPSHISLIEMGKRRPSVATLEKLTKALGIPIHLFTLLAAEPGDLKTANYEGIKRVADALADHLLNSATRSRRRRAKPRLHRKA